ncbi:hypothetical protein ACIQRW_29740 [Streptomyces sp. NPDC091287]|uniref:hypothetical protein n=1 Tax=Streptomyces sp. NPDC091287 TaxID=3365988 RepID=UPI00381C14B0
MCVVNGGLERVLGGTQREVELLAGSGEPAGVRHQVVGEQKRRVRQLRRRTMRVQDDLDGLLGDVRRRESRGQRQAVDEVRPSCNCPRTAPI